MSKTRIELDIQGVKDNLLNSDMILPVLEEYAKQQASQQYDDFHIMTFKGNQRAHSIAFPNTKEHPS